MDEAAFRTSVLIPLLTSMGYRDVDHTHGANELGKDIVAWKEDEDGSRVFTAVVAKVGPIRGGTGDAGTVATQVRQAFNSPILDKVGAGVHRAHFVIVATTGTIKGRSKEAILPQLEESQRNRVRFWDGSKVRELVDRYLPESKVPDYLAAVHGAFKGLKHFDVQATVGSNGIVHVVTPREDDVVVAQGVFSFPDTAEGDAAMAAWKRFLEEGEEVTISGEHIESLIHHEELVRVFGSVKPIRIELGPAAPDPTDTVTVETIGGRVPLRFEGLPPNSSKFGTVRGEIRTDASAEPLFVTVRLEQKGKDANEVSTSLGLNPSGHPPRRAALALRVWEAITDGAGYRLVRDRTGEVLVEVHDTAGSPRRHPLADYVCNLVTIEDRFGWSLRVPESVTPRDVLDAAELRSVLESGTYTETFTTYTIGLRLDAARMDAMLSVIEGGTSFWLKTRGGGKYSILDREVDLGIGHTSLEVCLSAKEADRVRTLAGKGQNHIRVRFEAAGSKKALTVYRDFLPEDLSDRYEALSNEMPPLDWSQLRLPDPPLLRKVGSEAPDELDDAT